VQWVRERASARHVQLRRSVHQDPEGQGFYGELFWLDFETRRSRWDGLHELPHRRGKAGAISRQMEQERRMGVRALEHYVT